MEPAPGRSRLLKFAASFTAALLLSWLVFEPSFTRAQGYVLFLLFLAMGLWLTEAVPPFSVGILILAYLPFTLGMPLLAEAPQDVRVYLNTFSSPVIWLMLGGFFLASAMSKTRLDADLIRVTLRVCGSDPKRVLFGLMVLTMLFSMLISNTATTAMVIAALMPILTLQGTGSPASRGLILGIPIAATTGGMGTILGSPPNAIAVGVLAGAGRRVGFLEWMAYGVPLALLLTFIAWWILVRRYLRDAATLATDRPPAGAEERDPAFRARRLTVASILAVTLLLWLSEPIHGLGATAVSAVPLVLFPLLGILGKDDVRAMGWDTLLLVAGGLALGTGLKQTGLLDLYAGRIASLEVSPVVFCAILAYATMAFSNVMSHTATSTVLIPIGLTILPSNAVEVCMVIGLSASTALFLPVSTPPNAIAYGTGLIEQKDLRLGGALIGLLGPAFIVAWVLAVSAMLGATT